MSNEPTDPVSISTNPPPVPPRPIFSTPSNTSYSNYGHRLQYVPQTTTNTTSQSTVPSSTVVKQQNGLLSNTNEFPKHNNILFYQENQALQLVERKSRNALRYVEHIIATLDSLSEMLETTLNAFYTCSRTIVSAVDNLIGLKHHFQRIFATFAVFKFFRWLYRFVLSLVGASSVAPRADDIAAQGDNLRDMWRSLNSSAGPSSLVDLNQSLPNTVVATISPAPVTPMSNFLVCALTIAGPVLLYKLGRRLFNSIEKSRRWATGEDAHYEAIALFNFDASSPNEISLVANQKLRIAPKELQPAVKGWLLGSVDGNEIGLVPGNYVRILSTVPNRQKH